MGEIQSYRDLIAWQKSMDVCVAVHRKTARFPKEETYGLAQHARRSAVSVSSNIAEGWGRGAIVEFLRFLRIARGSLCELETQVCLAECLGYLSPDDTAELNALTGESSKVMQGLIGSLERKQAANDNR